MVFHLFSYNLYDVSVTIQEQEKKNYIINNINYFLNLKEFLFMNMNKKF